MGRSAPAVGAGRWAAWAWVERTREGLALTHAAGFEVIAVTTLDPSCITRVLDEAGHTLQPEGSGTAWGHSHNQRRS